MTGFVANGQSGLFFSQGTAFLPDGNLSCASENSGRVERCSGPNSVSPVPGSNNPSGGNTGANWSSAITQPVGLAVGPNRNSVWFR